MNGVLAGVHSSARSGGWARERRGGESDAATGDPEEEPAAICIFLTIASRILRLATPPAQCRRTASDGFPHGTSHDRFPEPVAVYSPRFPEPDTVDSQPALLEISQWIPRDASRSTRAGWRTPANPAKSNSAARAEKRPLLAPARSTGRGDTWLEYRLTLNVDRVAPSWRRHAADRVIRRKHAPSASHALFVSETAKQCGCCSSAFRMTDARRPHAGIAGSLFLGECLHSNRSANAGPWRRTGWSRAPRSRPREGRLQEDGSDAEEEAAGPRGAVE